MFVCFYAMANVWHEPTAPWLNRKTWPHDENSEKKTKIVCDPKWIEKQKEAACRANDGCKMVYRLFDIIEASRFAKWISKSKTRGWKTSLALRHCNEPFYPKPTPFGGKTTTATKCL